MEGLKYVVHIFLAGGLVMYPLLILSLVTLAVGVERWQYFRIHTRGAKGFAHGVYHAAKQQDWSVVKELCREYPTAQSRVIENGLDYGSTEQSMKGAFDEQLTVESAGFRRYLDYLSAIVTIAPLLGLLGTVTGMIGTFSVLDSGDGAAAISGGVGEALIATASGLCVAIIAFCVYTYFSHRLDTVITDTENLCVTVLNAQKKVWEEDAR